MVQVCSIQSAFTVKCAEAFMLAIYQMNTEWSMVQPARCMQVFKGICMRTRQQLLPISTYHQVLHHKPQDQPSLPKNVQLSHWLSTPVRANVHPSAATKIDMDGIAPNLAGTDNWDKTIT